MIVYRLIFPCVLQVSIFLPSYMYMYIQSCLLQEMNDAKKKEKRRLRSKSAPPKLGQPKHTGKRKQRTEESMIAAMETVKSGISVSRAALEHKS